MLRNWYIRENVKYVSILLIVSLCYSLFFPPLAHVSAAENALTQQKLINSLQGIPVTEKRYNAWNNAQDMVVAANSPITPGIVVRGNAGMNTHGLADVSPKKAIHYTRKRGQTEGATNKTGRSNIGFHVNPHKRSISPTRKTKYSSTISSQPAPIVGFIIDPDQKTVKAIKKARSGTKTSVSDKQSVSSSSTIENQCEVIAPSRMLRSCPEDKESDCSDDAELWMSFYEYEYKEGNLLEIRASYKNITAAESFLQPFCFTVNEKETTLDKIDVITLPDPEDLQKTFGDDEVLSPGETTTLLTYSVVHKGKAFSFYIDANAVVEESDTTCNVKNECEASGDARVLEPCSEENETNCSDGAELWMSGYKETFVSDTLLEITASFKNITDTKIFLQPLCFTINEETACDKIELITLPETEDLQRAFGDDGSLFPSEITQELTFRVEHRGDPFSFYIDANAVVEKAPEPMVTISAEPLSIMKGASTMLSWSSTDATTAEIDQGIGSVGVNGSKEVSPLETTTYTITVTGDGGTAHASVTVAVTIPEPLPSPTVTTPTPSPSPTQTPTPSPTPTPTVLPTPLTSPTPTPVVNRPPTIISNPFLFAMKGEPYGYDAEARDPDRDDVLTFSLDAAPDGMTIDAGSGLISWTPAPDQVGENEATVRVQDQGGLSDTQSFTVTVASQDVDLAISSIDASSLAFDGQALTVSGDITANITNNGPEGVVVPVDVLFFEDLDFNGSYDAAIDNVLGRTNITEPLSAGASVAVTAALSGSVWFSGAPVWGFVDSEKRIFETNEGNNLARSGSGCQAVPPVGVIDPVLEWSWTSTEVEPDSLNVLMTPAIIDLNEDGIPDVVFGSTSSTGSMSESGVLRALNGRDGTEIFTVTDPTLRINVTSNVAVGDIDLDGRPEIVTCSASGYSLIVFEHDGTFKWSSPYIENGVLWGVPSLADLDNDGISEIIIGRNVLNNDGSLRWTGTGGYGSHWHRIHPLGSLSLVADVNLDGSPDVVAGNTIYNADGSIQVNIGTFCYGCRDGLNAVANFDDDDFPEIVSVSRGYVSLYEHDLSPKWGPIGVPGGGRGGPPTIADFDNDGELEIGVAGANRYVVFETDGSIKWQTITQDYSSSCTGSSVFDFDGDGSAEVVYRDELYLRIYRGIDGTTLFETPMSSCTWYEYVLVADVDADGNAEIVAVANNNCGKGPQRGVFVYGSASDSWVSTRQIWNQHTYHITNVNDDGTIPAREENNWEVYNNYRQNILPETSGLYDAPDLISSYVQVSEGGSNFIITARIGNAGVVTVGPGVSIAFYDGDPNSGGILLGTTKTTTYIDPGKYEDVSFTVSAAVIQNLFVSADDDGTRTGSVSECNELNNIYDRGKGVIVPSNRPPEITSAAITTATKGEPYSYDVEATDADGDVLTYSLVTFPENMTINAATGLIEWAPNGDQVGDHAVVVRVEDGKGGSDQQSFILKVLRSDTNCETSLVSWWPFNDSAFDIVDGNNPSDVNISGYVSGKVNNGALFERGSFIDIPHAENLENQEFTINAWVRPDGPGPNNDWHGSLIISKAPAPPIANLVVEVCIWWSASDNRFKYAVNANVFINHYANVVVSTNEFPAGTFYHVVATYDGAKLKLYVNGNLEGELEQSSIITYNPDFTWSIGSSNTYYRAAGWPRTWNGVIDEVGIFNRALDESEIQVIFNEGHAGLCNNPPEITSSYIAEAVINETYAYDVEATDADGDVLTYSLVTFPENMTINASTGFIAWVPNDDQVGDHAVTVRVEDGKGGSDSQTFTITVSGGTTTNLTVSMHANPESIIVGGTSTLTWSSTNATSVEMNQGIGSVAVNGSREVSPTETTTYTITVTGDEGTTSASATVVVSSMATVPDVIGMSQAEAKAAIALAGLVVGNITEMSTVDMPKGRVFSQNPLEGSVVSAHAAVDISVSLGIITTDPKVTLISPEAHADITSPADIIASITDPDPLDLTWETRFAPVGTQDFRVIGSGAGTVNAAPVGRFDPTLLANDTYRVEINWKKGPRTGGIFFDYSVSGNLKVGNFRLEFVDLQIPLAGIPITIKRVYDTLDLKKGDFGVGWTLGYPGVVRDSAPEGTAFSLRSRVYVTMPDGRRIGFKFTPVQVSPWFPFIFKTAFTPDPGVYDSLSVDEAHVVHSAGYFYTGLFTGNFNPSQYTLTTKDGTKYVLHEQDGLLSVEDLHGNILTVTDTGITHSSGTNISFVRDTEDRIREIIDPDGHSIHYTYDAIGDLVSVTNREGAITTLTYFSQPAHFLDRIIDPLGNVGIRSEYDENGRLIAIYDADGNRIAVNHSLADSQEIITDARGNKTIVLYDNRGNVISETNALGETTLNTYDEKGNLLSRTNPAGETIQFTYDDQGNALSRTDNMGNKTQYTYNTFGQPTSITDPSGNVYTFQYDASGNLIRRGEPTGSEFVYEYDSRGSMTRETDPLGFVSLFQYDSAGNQISRTDPLGNKTSFTYDALGNRTSSTRLRTDANGVKQTITTQSQYDKEGRLVSTTDPAGNVEMYTYDQSGKLTVYRDKRGVVAAHSYDVRGNKTRTEYADGSFETAEYDEANNLLSKRDRNGTLQTFEYNAVNQVTHAVDPMGRKNDREYDTAGRINALILSGIRSEIEHDSGKVFSKSLSLDDPIATRPRITKITSEDGFVTNLGYDQNGNITNVASSDGKNMSVTFTQDNIAKQFVTADGTTTKIDFDAKSQPEVITNPGGVDYAFTLDALGRITGAVDPLGGNTIYRYDEIGNKVSQTDANGNITRWEYDNRGKVTRRILPEGMSEQFVYNQVGEMIGHTDFNGARTTFQYDAQGRIILKECSDGTSTRFIYDNEGRLLSVQDGRGTTNYQYDAYGRNTRVDFPEGSFIAYTYDERANRSRMTTPSGTTRYTYDSLNRIQSITDIRGGVTQYHYDDAARTTTIVRPNGTRSVTTRDGEGRTATLIHNNAAGDVLSRYDVTYDEPNGRRVIQENTGRTVTYFYDALHRLIREQIVDPVNGNEAINYTYDAAGNRLTRTDSTGTIHYVYDRNNRLLSAGGVTYSYDRNGNCTGKDGSGGHWTFVYDCDNRLTRFVSPAGVTSTYSYDHDGARIASIENGVTTRYLIDKNVQFHQVVTDLDEANNPLVHYTYNGIEILSRKQLSGGDSYYLEDPLESVRQLTDAGGGITDTYLYDTFSRNLRSQGSTPNRYRYLSEENDVATGLVYLRARYLDPETGRFLGMDPVQGYAHDPRSQHPYMYGFNDPTSFVDRSGEFVGLALTLSNILVRLTSPLAGMGYALTAVIGSQAALLGGLLAASNVQWMASHFLFANTTNLTLNAEGIGGFGISSSQEGIAPTGLCNSRSAAFLSFGIVFETGGPLYKGGKTDSQTTGSVFNVCNVKDYTGPFVEGAFSLGPVVLWDQAFGRNEKGELTGTLSAGRIKSTGPYTGGLSFAIRQYFLLN